MPNYAGDDSLQLLVQRLQDGPKAAKAAVVSSAELDIFTAHKMLSKVDLKTDRKNRPSSALRQQRIRMYEELKKMQAPVLRSTSNSTLRDQEEPCGGFDSPKGVRQSGLVRQCHESDACLLGVKPEQQRLLGGDRVSEPLLLSEPQHCAPQSPLSKDFAAPDAQARPATRDSDIIAPDVLAQQRKMLLAKVVPGGREGSRTQKSRRQKSSSGKTSLLSGSPSAPCLGEQTDTASGSRPQSVPDKTSLTRKPLSLGPEVRTEGTFMLTDRAKNAATATPAALAAAPAPAMVAAGDDCCGIEPSRSRPKPVAWSLPEPAATAAAIHADEAKAAPSLGPHATKETPTAWAAPAPAAPAVAAAVTEDAAATPAAVSEDAVAAAVAANTVDLSATSTSAATNAFVDTSLDALTVVPRKDAQPSSARMSFRSRQKSAATSAEAKVAAALDALDMEAEALLEAAVGRRSQYQTGTKPDVAALLAGAQRGERPDQDCHSHNQEADPSGGRVPQFLNRVGRDRGARNRQSVEKEKLDAARFLARNSPEEMESCNKLFAEKEQLSEKSYFFEAGKMNGLEAIESPAMLEAFLPASTLDLMEFETAPNMKFGQLSSSKTKPSELVTAFEKLPYSVPFDLASWDKSASEAFNEMFGANHLNLPKKSRKAKSSSKLSRKRKKEKDQQVECSVQTDIQIAPANSSEDLTTAQGLSAVEPAKVNISIESSRAQPERQRPKSASLSQTTRLPGSLHEAADAQATELASSSSAQQGACHDLRPSSAAASRETLTRLAGFDMPEGNVPYSAWDTCKEVYSAWGGNDDLWEDSAVNDWGVDDASMQLLVY